MTYKDYLNRHRASTMDELHTMLTDLKESGKQMSQEELIAYALDITSNAVTIYNTGFDRCVDLIEQADTSIMRRHIPPHTLLRLVEP